MKVEAVAVVTAPAASLATSSGAVSTDELDVFQILGNNLDYIDDPLQGQKKPTPSPGSGIRVFYESLASLTLCCCLVFSVWYGHGVS